MKGWDGERENRMVKGLLPRLSRPEDEWMKIFSRARSRTRERCGDSEEKGRNL